jgi:hypothetical protein
MSTAAPSAINHRTSRTSHQEARPELLPEKRVAERMATMSKRMLFELMLLFVVLASIASVSAFVTQQQQQQQQQQQLGVWRDDSSGFSPLFARSATSPEDDMNANDPNNRRAFLASTARTTAVMTTFALACTTSDAAYAKAGGRISPEEAYQRLLGAREELIAASKEYIAKRDVKGLKSFLTDPDSNVNRMDTSMQALLESKALDAESKKAIGTIRTYGVGADVIISYGGLKAAFLSPGGMIEEEDDDDDDDDTLKPNWGEVQKYLFRTVDSLQEVIVICRSNGFK